MHTHQTVHDIIQGEWESELPDKIMEALRPFDGKPVTTRILAKLPADNGGGEWRLRRQYGMTHLENAAYGKGDYKHGVSLLLDWKENSFPLEWAKLEERNGAYFSGRRERNHARMELMNTKGRLDAASTAMNRIEAAIEALWNAHADLSKAIGEALSGSDKYDIERACGWRDEKGETVR